MTKNNTKHTYLQNDTLRIPTHKEFARKYSGNISELDFYTGCKQYPSNIAYRILSDRRFDEQCRKNELARERKWK